MTQKTQEQLEQERIEKQQKLEKIAEDNCILRVVAGSNAYGTNNPSSDWDERGIFVDEMPRIVLPFEKIEQVTLSHDDIVLFELSKYMPLLLTQNPNVIELIWTDEKDVLHKTELGQLLLDNRKSFLSKQVKESYAGYAHSQLKRIKGHNKWINNPQPEQEPEPKDFTSVVWNFSGAKEFNKKVPFSGFVAIDLGDGHYSLWSMDKLKIDRKPWIDKRGNPNPIPKQEFEKFNPNNLPPDMIVKLNKTLFESHHTNWKAYWNWKTHRNEKRSELEEKYGYDVKHAMHLIRLLRSGVDILEHGIVPVRRPDREYLLDIRNGKYTYEEIVAESERLTQKVEEVSKKTLLPSEPDYGLAREIMMEIYTKQWNLSPKEIKQAKPGLKP
jgi:predicted nucleotidyltransferase